MESVERAKSPTIMVPLDGSPMGEWALPLALALARRQGARLHLAAVEQPYPMSHRQLFLEPVRWARKYLTDVGKRLAAAGFRDVDASVLGGEVVPSLETRAQKLDPTLIVMATHGRGTLSRLWLGSATADFIRRTRWPVLVVRPQQEQGPTNLDLEFKFRRMLVTLDGSAASESILEPALALREAVGANLSLLRVVQFPTEAPPPFHRGPTHIDPSILGILMDEAREYMERIVSSLEERGVPVSGEVTVAERPAEAIVAACQEHSVDLIALSTQGRGALGKVVVGSVADKVVRSATVPVLLVRRELPPES